jgi:hypothetical protein
MAATIDPEPTAAESEAILAALAASGRETPAGWADAALAEGVEPDELDP